MYEFKGWDYTELAEALGINMWEGEDEDVKLLQNYVRERMWIGDADGQVEQNRVIEICRAFLQSIIDNYPDDGWTPVWQGVQNIKDNFTYLQVFTQLLPNMWT